MSGFENYGAMFEIIQSIPEKAVRSPNNVPVEIYLLEAEKLYYWCQEDKDVLFKNGLSMNLIDDLPVRCRALGEAQKRWLASVFKSEAAEKECSARLLEIYNFRNKLIHIFRFAYRKDYLILSRVNNVVEGFGHDHIIKDLSDLVVLGNNFSYELENINFDFSLLDKAKIFIDEMSSLFGEIIKEQVNPGPELKIRNRAFTYLKEAVDEIRAYGQYISWCDENRLCGYTSDYRGINILNRKDIIDDLKDPLPV